MERVLVVGAGLAGLACAQELRQAGVDPLVLEAGDSVGGRVRTDTFDGFRLDHGFQVLLEAYPEAQRLLDLPALSCGRFRPGAVIRAKGRFRRLGDPQRDPAALWSTLTSGLGTWSDRFAILGLKRTLTREDARAALAVPDHSTLEELRSLGFSEELIEAFFRPFLGGIFLDRPLATSQRMFRFVFRMFSLGDALLPAGGMQRIPEQLAAGLSADRVRTGVRVATVDAGGVVLEDGNRVDAEAVVLATEMDTAAHLLGESVSLEWNGVDCLYFDAPESPVGGADLVLNGEGQGPINNLCVPSDVAAGYAPEGRSLVSVTTLDTLEEPEDALRDQVVQQLRTWYGADVDSWRFLRHHRIRRALPAQRAGWLDPPSRTGRHPSGVYVAGDHVETASSQGALSSGVLCARKVLAEVESLAAG